MHLAEAAGAAADGIIPETTNTEEDNNDIQTERGDEVGSLDKLLEFITSSYINVDYLYLSFNRKTSTPIVILHAPDSDELENFLQSKGYATVK